MTGKSVRKVCSLKKVNRLLCTRLKKKMRLITSLTWGYSLHPELEVKVADLVQTDSNGVVNIREEML